MSFLCDIPAVHDLPLKCTVIPQNELSMFQQNGRGIKLKEGNRNWFHSDYSREKYVYCICSTPTSTTVATGYHKITHCFQKVTKNAIYIFIKIHFRYI